MGDTLIDMTGQRVGRLTVVGRGEDYYRGNGKGVPRWDCLCSCGSRVLVRGQNLRNGTTTSCGCWRIDVAISMGKANRRDVVCYDSVHRRLKEERGPARQYPCVDCGALAREWSYDHADPDELLEQKDRRGYPEVFAYSLKPEHYAPRCKSCHARFDING